MTNEMIILWESVGLMEQGLIGTTGRQFMVKDKDGNERVVMEPEPIHTFARWKDMGYSVRKGEKAIASFLIWKGAEKHATDKDGNELPETTVRMFMKRSSFFSAKQVEPLRARS